MMTHLAHLTQEISTPSVVNHNQKRGGKDYSYTKLNRPSTQLMSWAPKATVLAAAREPPASQV